MDTFNDFIEFIEEHSATIRDNMNLNDDLLLELKSKNYIQQYDYSILQSKTDYQRQLMFVDILCNQPDDYMQVDKTEVLIGILGDRKHSRKRVQNVFIAWKNRLLVSRRPPPAYQQGHAEIPEAGEPNQELKQYSGSFDTTPEGSFSGGREKVCNLKHPPTKQVQVATSDRSSSEVPELGVGFETINNITNFINSTITNNQVNITNSLTYFKNHAETYNFMNFALPANTTEECAWVSLANLPDGLLSGRRPKKHTPSGNGLALLLNWSFDTNPADLPMEILGNRAMLERYLRYRRKGSEQDTNYVCSKFAKLTGRQVVQELNIKTTEHLQERLAAFRKAALELTPPPTYITVVVSTHGLNGYQLLLDHLGLADLFKDIVYQLSDKAPGFKDSAHFGSDMPRLFFVQACQQDVPAEMAAGIKNEFPNVLSSASNFMVGLATIPSHVAWRNEGTGSYYIKYIHDCFEKGKSLHEMMKEVDRKIRKKFDQKTSAYLSLDFPITDFEF